MRIHRRCRPLACLCAAALAAVILGLTASAPAQSTLDWPLRDFVPRTLDTGVLENTLDAPAVVYDAVVSVESSAWLRLYFASADLDPGSFIRTTSLLDGEFQELDAASLSMWHNTTAYFNGGAVRLEVIAGPHTVQNRLVLDRVAVYMPGGGPRACGVDGCGYCGADDRVPSTELWSGRLMPVGCTGSVYNQQSCVVSAGHCAAGGSDNIIQFNVPDSSADCYTYNPPVADQFPITNHLYSSNGVGDDWSVMLTGTNGLGQRPYDRYGIYRPIATTLANSGNAVSVWGYGVDDSPSPTRSQTQQTSSGAIGSRQSTYYTHSVDITYGNSGSGLIRNNEIIGIITHCDYNCTNPATRVDLAAFAAARDSLCPLTNDYCASALVVGNGSYSGTTVGATNDGAASCGSSTTSPDVWYKYVTMGTGTLTVGTCTASYNTVLSVHTGCPGTTGNQIGCNDNSNTCGTGSTRSYLAVSVTGGATYYIRVSGNNGATGTFTLAVAGPADNMPPTPNPMTFAASPAPYWETPTIAINMSATPASDPTTPIQYAFEANTGPAYPGADSRDWSTARAYSDTGLTPNTSYVYRAKARDGALSATSPSADASATTYIETPTRVAFGTVTNNSIVLNAAGTLTNLTVGSSGAYFDSTTPGGNGGINEWVQVTTDTATGLSADTSYTFQVKARNQNGIETDYSPTAAKATLANVPAAPTLANPTTSTMTLDVNANGNPTWTVFAIQCTATSPNDAAWLNKYVNAAGASSASAVWQTELVWANITVSSLQPATTYTFAVKARNQESIETAFGPVASLPTLPLPTGACCYGDAPCAITTQAACGGTYQGNNTTCTPYLCCPTVMGDLDGNGVVDGADIQGFVDAMLAGFAPCADLVAPYGVLDMADVSAFVNLLLGP